MKRMRWKSLCLMIILGLNVGLFLGDCVASVFLSTPLSFRFEDASSIKAKTAPKSIKLSCDDSSFHAEEVYCLHADASGKGTFESAVEWSIESGSLSYYISANRFYFTSDQPGEAAIKACSSLDKSVSSTFEVTFQSKAKAHAPKTYSTPTFFYSSGSSIISYTSETTIPYDQPLKLNLLLQNEEHESAYTQPTFQLTSDCYSKIDGFGNLLLDPRDIKKTISGTASIDTGNSRIYTKDFSFTVLYPTNQTAKTFGLYFGSFLLNSLPFLVSSFCLSLLLEQKNASPQKAILVFALFGVLLVGLNVAACLLVSGENLILTLVNSTLSYLLGTVLRRIRGFLPRGKAHE